MNDLVTDLLASHDETVAGLQAEIEKLRAALGGAAENFDRLTVPHIVGNDVHNFAHGAAKRARAALTEERTPDHAK